MRHHIAKRALLSVGLCAALTACEPGVVSDGASFQRNYASARRALEAGNYESAIRSYAALIPNAGPFEPRLRLEYAHALLRAGRYDEAAEVADVLAGGLQGGDRAAALAVSGTARHESALSDIRSGTAGPGTVTKLRGADAALTEVIATDPDLDPLGAMTSRRADIRRELAQLGASG